MDDKYVIQLQRAEIIRLRRQLGAEAEEAEKKKKVPAGLRKSLSGKLHYIADMMDCDDCPQNWKCNGRCPLMQAADLIMEGI